MSIIFIIIIIIIIIKTFTVYFEQDLYLIFGKVHCINKIYLANCLSGHWLVKMWSL